MFRMRSISASLQAHRASILRDGARRFYVSTADRDAANLSSVPRSSISECLGAARDWLRKFSLSPCCAFSITERAELPGQSVVASHREVLVFREIFPVPKRGGSDSGARAERVANREQAERPPKRATIKES